MEWQSQPGLFCPSIQQNNDGKYVAFIDDAKTNSKTYKGLMVIQASMKGANLCLKTPFRGPEINGKLNFFGNRINGTVKVMEADSPPRYLTTPLSLTRLTFQIQHRFMFPGNGFQEA